MGGGLELVPLMIEYQAVMTRQEHLEAFGSTYEEVNELLDTIAGVAVPIVLDYLWRPILRDPDDDMVLETAVNGRADTIVCQGSAARRWLPSAKLSANADGQRPTGSMAKR